jgi:putative ABC transport system permease protein
LSRNRLRNGSGGRGSRKFFPRLAVQVTFSPSDLAVPRTVGATPRQLLRFFVCESLLVIAIGVTLAVASNAVNLAALRIALRRLFGDGSISAPYPLIAGAAAVSGLLALIGRVVPVGAARRARTVHLVSASE